MIIIMMMMMLSDALVARRTVRGARRPRGAARGCAHGRV